MGKGLSPPQCYGILETHSVPEHIQRHSEQVARVARRLLEALERWDDVTLDRSLVEAGALLHDVAKAECLVSRKDHAVEGARILRERGLEAVAPLVERHVNLGNWDPEGPITEVEILNYSDKRVRHEEVVTLRERFLDLLDRYGKTPQSEARILHNWRCTVAVERKIFAKLPIDPDDLME